MAQEKRYKLKVTRPSSLLSSVIDVYISERQLVAVRDVLDKFKKAERAISHDTFTDPDSWGGIEQYQAEDR